MSSRMYDGQVPPHGRQVSTLTPVLEHNSPAHGWMGTPLFALPLQIAVLDRLGTIVTVNEAWKRSARDNDTPGVADGSVGMNYLAVCRQAFPSYREDIRAVEASIRAVLNGTWPHFSTEYAHDFPTGRRWFLLQVSPLPGNLSGAVVLHLDITGRKLTEEEWASSLVRERGTRAEVPRARPERRPKRVTAAQPGVELEPTGSARLRALEVLTDTALSHLALDDLMRELLDRMLSVMAVDNAAILLLEEDGKTLTVRAARGLEEQVVGRVKVPIGHGFAGRVAASRRPLLLDDLATAEVVTPLLREKLRSLVGVPLLVDDRLVGVVHVGSGMARRFTQQDVDLLLLVADRIAQAVERARLFAAEREARAQAEEALAQATASEARATERAEHLQTILETIADGVAVSDHAGHLLRTNRAFRELLALDRVPEDAIIPSADRGHHLQVQDAAGVPISIEQLGISRALRGEEAQGPETDISVRTADGRELEVTMSAAPLRDHEGGVVGAVAVARDISWRRRLEREREEAHTNELALKETTQRLDEFLATAAHDLRSPLAVTLTAIDLVASRFERLASAITTQNPNLADKIGPIRSCLDEANQSVDRLSRMVTMLFDTAQLRAGKLKLHRRSCDLATVVHEQADALRKAHPNRTIQVQTPDDLSVHVAADVDRIEQVVTNYVTNALKYSAEDQLVEVRVAIEGPLARVSVRDHGPGLPSTELERIWQRFYRVQSIHTQNGQDSGLGLGLYICKTIIERHGGYVGVESTPDAGSTFWFTLPTRRQRSRS